MRAWGTDLKVRGYNGLLRNPTDLKVRGYIGTEGANVSELHFSPRPNRAHDIRWRPWGEAAFAESKEQNKPVLLAISGVWCHWCHVMDETTYSDRSVIAAINERFIPVRVDNDQRPDVNARYNMGGWPTTVLLTPDGEVLYGGTYIPPDAMRQVLKQIDGFYQEPDNRLAIIKRVQELKAARGARARTPTGADLDPTTAADVMATLSSAFDEEYGGFGTDQKFPHVGALQFLLDFWSRHHDERALTIVQRTLHAMSQGGTYDHVHGGFFRYSTTRDFSVPHFEKMLEDLGGLLQVCARAGAMFDDPGLTAVALDVKRYLDGHLWNGAFGGYGGSQDADEQYYALDADGRAGLAEPFVDKILYTSWNAQAARALLLGAPLARLSEAGTAAWTQRGLEVLESLWNKLLVDGMMCRFFDGAPHVRGLLTDQAWSAWAALAAYEATGQRLWLDRCGALVGHAEELFDGVAEGYLDRLPAPDDTGRVAEPLVALEDNALMARVLLAYAAAIDQDRYAERARAMLKRFARDHRSHGLFAAGYASAVLDILEPPVDVHVVGSNDDSAVRSLRAAALATTSPPIRIDSHDPARDAERIAALGAPEGDAIAYLCRGTACFARITSAGELPAALSAALAG